MRSQPLGSLANVLLLTVVARAGMLVLLLVSLGIGGPGRIARRTLALTTGVRNAAVALVIASGNFAGTPAMTAVVACSLVSIFGTLGCAILLGRTTTVADSSPISNTVVA